MLLRSNRTKFRRNIIVTAVIVAVVRTYLGGFTATSLWRQPARIGIVMLVATVALLAALGLRWVAGLFFQRPWYASLPAMLLLAVALKSIVRIVAFTYQSACERLELPQVVAKDQLGLLTIALTLMWVVLLDSPNGPRSVSFTRRGRSALPAIRSRGTRDTITPGIDRLAGGPNRSRKDHCLWSRIP